MWPKLGPFANGSLGRRGGERGKARQSAKGEKARPTVIFFSRARVGAGVIRRAGRLLLRRAAAKFFRWLSGLQWGGWVWCASKRVEIEKHKRGPTFD